MRTGGKAQWDWPRPLLILQSFFRRGVCDVCSASNNQQCHIFSFRKSLLALQGLLLGLLLLVLLLLWNKYSPWRFILLASYAIFLRFCQTLSSCLSDRQCPPALLQAIPLLLLSSSSSLGLLGLYLSLPRGRGYHLSPTCMCNIHISCSSQIMTRCQGEQSLLSDYT